MSPGGRTLVIGGAILAYALASIAAFLRLMPRLWPSLLIYQEAPEL